jgi:hypothetical protein
MQTVINTFFLLLLGTAVFLLLNTLLRGFFDSQAQLLKQRLRQREEEMAARERINQDALRLAKREARVTEAERALEIEERERDLEIREREFAAWQRAARSKARRSAKGSASAQRRQD